MYINANNCIFFRPKLKEHMQYCVDHPEEMNKLAKVQAQISEVKGVMMENIEKVTDFIEMQIECYNKGWFCKMTNSYFECYIVSNDAYVWPLNVFYIFSSASMILP